tara:strand:- start:383 stop:496 length:114 start_codon:yes stop_codon:yes gene_type:complete
VDTALPEPAEGNLSVHEEAILVEEEGYPNLFEERVEV